MKKYIEIARFWFKMQLAYRFDVGMSALLSVSKILFAYILWGAIFGERETVAGFTFTQMLSYYVISSFLAQIELSEGVSDEMSRRIHNGTFSKYMVIPANVNGYFVAQTLGAMGFYLIIAVLTAAAWVLLFRVELALTAHAAALLSAALLVLLGLLFMIQLNVFLGLLAFRYLDIGMFLMIKNNLVSFITGGLVPLALLPQGLVSAMRVFPFYYVTYLPSMLLIGKNLDEALPGILTLGAWLAALLLLNRFAYNKLRVLYDGVGI